MSRDHGPRRLQVWWRISDDWKLWCESRIVVINRHAASLGWICLVGGACRGEGPLEKNDQLWNSNTGSPLFIIGANFCVERDWDVSFNVRNSVSVMERIRKGRAFGRITRIREFGGVEVSTPLVVVELQESESLWWRW